MSKNKLRNNNLFDIEKSTSTFINLMTKYHKQKNKTKNKDKFLVMREIDEKRYKLEIEEKDNMFIYKEAKNLAYINQELINKYGTKAKSQTYDVSKLQGPIKIGKSNFFDPTNENNLQSNSSLKVLKKGIIKLPLISQNSMKYNKKPLLTYNNSNISKNKNNDIKNFKINTDYFFKSNKTSKLDSPINKNSESNFGTDTNICPSSFRNSKSDRNILLTEIAKNKNIKKNNFRNRNDKYFSNKNIFSYNGSYLTKLSNFKEELIKEEKEKRNYFDRNDYGYKLFKEKYDFLNKKYFE